jgi:hypothetical protein
LDDRVADKGREVTRMTSGTCRDVRLGEVKIDHDARHDGTRVLRSLVSLEEHPANAAAAIGQALLNRGLSPERPLAILSGNNDAGRLIDPDDPGTWVHVGPRRPPAVP